MKKMKKKKDPKYLNIPNICFSLVDKDSEQEKEFKKQRLTRGFDDSETWCLTSTFCDFMIPRLERYLELTEDMFADQKKNRKKIKKFLKALKKLQKGSIITKEEDEKIHKHLSYFPEIFRTLWW